MALARKRPFRRLQHVIGFLGRRLLVIATILPGAAAAQPASLPRLLAQAAPGACAAPNIAVEPLPGGQSQFYIEDACRAGQAVRFTYSGVDFDAVLDSGGRLTFVLDCFAGVQPPVEVRFQDGTSYSRAAVAGDLQRVSKVAVVWQAWVDLDLHAFEYAARPGSPGHIWANAPSSMAAARQGSISRERGQGYISSSSAGQPGDGKVEVYTFWHHRRQTRGVIGLALDYASRGSLPQGETCGAGELAEVRFSVLVLNRDGRVKRAEGLLQAAECERPLIDAIRFNDAAVPDLFLGK